MVLMASCVSLFLPATKEWVIFIVIFSELIFFLFAEMSLHRGIERFFKDDEIITNLFQHSWRLRRRIIRYVFFCRALEELALFPTTQELDDCLQFIEANRSGRPPSWTSFFRHPITVAVIGIVIYTGNQSVILRAIQKDSWHAFLSSLSVVAILIMAGGWLYAMRYTTVQSDWELERAIRWYRIGRKE